VIEATRQDQVPVLDEDGLLRVGHRWIAIPDSQLRIVELLLARPMRVVRYEEIEACYRQAGGNPRRTAVTSMLTRLARRFRDVGIDLVSVRSRGVLLSLPPSPRR
jgi:DNA-binding winged helix-turn-helix (wHTH) protein